MVLYKVEGVKEIKGSGECFGVLVPVNVLELRFNNKDIKVPKGPPLVVNKKLVSDVVGKLEKVNDTEKPTSLFVKKPLIPVIIKPLSIIELHSLVKPPGQPSLPNDIISAFKEIVSKLENSTGTNIITRFEGWTFDKEALKNLITEGAFVDDHPIDIYLAMIKASCKKNVYIFDTSLLDLLERGDEKELRALTADVDIFSKDIVLFPCHLAAAAHWSLVKMTKCEGDIYTVECFDSLHKNNPDALNKIGEFIEKIRFDADNDASSNPVHSANVIKMNVDEEMYKFQQQVKPYCGIYVMLFALYLLKGKKFDFENKHICYFRYRFAYELIKKRLI